MVLGVQLIMAIRVQKQHTSFGDGVSMTALCFNKGNRLVRRHERAVVACRVRMTTCA